MRPARNAIGLLVMFALVLAACGGGGGSRSSPPPGPGPQPPSAQEQLNAKVGRLTKVEATALLGNPTRVTREGVLEVWTYDRPPSNLKAFAGALYFDNRGIMTRWNPR